MDRLARREFIRRSSLAAAAPMVPSWLTQVSEGLPRGGRRRRLVVIQMAGGNDGLSTLIPYDDPRLREARPLISKAVRDGASVDSSLAWSPHLPTLARLQQAGKLVAVQAVGYPNAHRSHFTSTDVWHTGKLRPVPSDTGWVGRYLDAECPQDTAACAVNVSGGPRRLLRGESTAGYDYANLARTATHLSVVGEANPSPLGLEGDAYVTKLLRTARQSTAYFAEIERTVSVDGDYPDTTFGRQLAQVGGLLLADAAPTVYYAEQGGYDTHVQQARRHERSHGEYDRAIAALTRQLRDARLEDEVLILTFSEFGRRVRENSGAGTDHGKANLCWLIGARVRQSKALGLRPDLGALDDGDLEMRVDFREVYAAVLRDWLGVDPRPLIGDFRPLPVLRA